jgi:hypothetical protein
MPEARFLANMNACLKRKIDAGMVFRSKLLGSDETV